MMLSRVSIGWPRHISEDCLSQPTAVLSGLETGSGDNMHLFTACCEFVSPQPTDWGCRKGSSGSAGKMDGKTQTWCRGMRSRGLSVRERQEPGSEAWQAPWRKRHHSWALRVQWALARPGERRRGKAEGTACGRQAAREHDTVESLLSLQVRVCM